MSNEFRFRKDEHKVLGAGLYSVDHEDASHVIYTGLYEGDTIVALLVAIDDDAHQNEISRIGNKIVKAANSHDQLVAALEAGRVAIDVLMAQLIEVDPSFKPTQSAAWPALVAIKAALDAAGAA